ncbi:MAG: hypothetical protein N2544_05985, partial [Burkholderiales bacterium]|nr:hypothetical protein [Burkholderiales bacterium]
MRARAGSRPTARTGLSARRPPSPAALVWVLFVLPFAALGQSATTAAPRYSHAGVPAPTAEDLAVVKPEWYTELVQRVFPCNLPYKDIRHYSACLRVFLSLQPPFDPARREHFGERYDPAKYYECRRNGRPNEGHCERLILRRRESPETWPHHVGKPAPIKWPEAPRESVYRPGMSALEYWRALCKAEAGEFIYRTVPGVTAIYQVRPRAKEPGLALGDRYVMEDPYGYIEAESGTLDNIPWFVAGP